MNPPPEVLDFDCFHCVVLKFAQMAVDAGHLTEGRVINDLLQLIAEMIEAQPDPHAREDAKRDLQSVLAQHYANARQSYDTEGSGVH